MIIGETAELGDNITLYQGVTLGGTGKEQGKRHPTLKDNVMVQDRGRICRIKRGTAELYGRRCARQSC